MVYLTPPPRSRRGALRLSRRRIARGALGRRVGARPLARSNESPVQLLALRLLGRGAIPVQRHLQREDSIEHETRNEVVQDERIGNFLEGGEDAREGAEEVVYDLLGIRFRLYIDRREKKK